MKPMILLYYFYYFIYIAGPSFFSSSLTAIFLRKLCISTHLNTIFRQWHQEAEISGQLDVIDRTFEPFHGYCASSTLPENDGAVYAAYAITEYPAAWIVDWLYWLCGSESGSGFWVK